MYIYNFLMNKYINLYLYKTSEIQRKNIYFLVNFTTMQEMRGKIRSFKRLGAGRGLGVKKTV